MSMFDGNRRSKQVLLICIIMLGCILLIKDSLFSNNNILSIDSLRNINHLQSLDNYTKDNQIDNYNENKNSNNYKDNDNKNICEIYVRPRFPKQKIRSFFHDLECIVSSFEYINGSIADCDIINMYTSKSFDYTHSAYSKLFNLTIINDKEFYDNPKSKYGCKRSMRWLSNFVDNKMTQFQQYIIRTFKLNQYIYNLDFYKSNKSNILIIDRHHHRGIANIDELYHRLCKLYGQNRVLLVYFDEYTIIKQYEFILNSSVIITPHGAAEASFLMVSNDRYIKNIIKLIELCPPYAHCPFQCNYFDKILNKSIYINFKKARLCPMFYNKYFKQHDIIGIARQDIHWDCYNYCLYQKEQNRHFEVELRRINNFTVDVDLVIKAINTKLTKPKGQNVLIKEVEMTGKEFYFFNSTITITHDYYDLNTTPRATIMW